MISPNGTEWLYSSEPRYLPPMPPALIKLVAMLLLIAQGVIALASGRVLCIPVQYCDTRETDVPLVCGSCCSDGCFVAGDSHGGLEPERGLFVTTLHPDDECGCHLHVPVPSDDRAPSNPKSDNSDLRALFFPLTFALVMAWVTEPPLQSAPHFEPPDFSTSDQVLALKSTHILI